ncbi:MAG: spermidine/putrescine ABC transporter substrate-binding protein [Synechococcales cyanobacterium C42_A2020_086]|nr:spermidine/putrescine ABC transporter substrate-binding protein [Synechococcales cyanobacterium M58_A2018_015]MBF2073105.1 spermidine/putrescine ABC transporter substrate-binding protein [Synechococcales cyanobacterium C42_A2020_086]
MPPTNPRKFSRLSPSPRFSVARRRFLQTSAAAVSGIVLSNCARNLSNNTAPSAETSPTADGTTATDSKTLHVFSWANYTDDELLKNFKDQTGISVVVDTFDSNETMLAKMQAGGGRAYSIIFPSDYMVEQMIELNMLMPLDRSRLKGIDGLMPKWQNPVYDANNAHSVPAVWGTTGLIFDPQRVQEKVRGWDYVWNNVDSLSRRLTMINDVREVFGATLQYLGYSLNSTKPAEIEEAYNKLLEIKPAIAAFMTNGWEDQLASGDLQISMAYSQDAIVLMEESPNLQYIVPESGSSLWTDTMVIPKSAPNPDAAYEWINFMLEPENSAKLVERLKFATPNEAAFNRLSPEVKNNENLFPPQAILDKCEGIAPVPQDIADLYDRFWTQLTST